MKTMNYSVVRTICSLIIGLVLVFWPDVATQYITITIGVLFLIPGIISLIGYFTVKPSAGKSVRFPIEGIGSLLFGLWLVAMPDFFANVLMFLLGFLLMMGGIQQIAALSMARRWSTVPTGFYVLPVLILVTGLITLFNPVSARHTILIIIGVTCLIYALTELVNWFKFSRKRPAHPSKGHIEDAEIIDPD